MTENRVSNWRDPRPIVERVQVSAKLVLHTPAHFGAGDPDPLSEVDMVLLRDPLQGKALLPGASLAGAMRNYLREVQLGYEYRSDIKRERSTWAVTLFGGSRGDDQGLQSLLIVDDALASAEDVELRDGVRIKSSTRTAAKGAKFDMELLSAGTAFDLSFELLVPKGRSEELRRILAIALRGFEEGEITLGARKKRGFGQCRVSGWRVNRYRLDDPGELVAWLDRRRVGSEEEVSSIAKALDVDLSELEDARHDFQIEADLELSGSLLVRSGFGEADTGPDMVHLHALQVDGEKSPILPGTSLAGVLRHRALRIANTLHPGRGARLVEEIFGSNVEGALTASRLTVGEAVVRGVRSLVQSRVKIDRFTGGAYETALFEEQPVFGSAGSKLRLQLSLRNPQPHEIGLFLLLLKDLWMEDLPVGGESSVGRGRLKGRVATITLRQGGKTKPQQWQIRQEGDSLQIDQPDELEKYVLRLKKRPWEADK